MKKLAIAMSVVAAMAGVSAVQAASTGTINFAGELTAATCNVSVNGQGATGATVSLPTVSANDLATDGATTDRTSFNLKLTECAGYLELEEGTASAFFAAGDTVDLTSGRLKNTEGDDYAQNVQLQLRDGSNAQRVIKVGDTAQVDDMGYVDITSGSATLPYLVEYYATGVATPGLVESSVVYALQYK